MSNSGGLILKKGPWSAAEDAILIDYVKKHGEGNWNAVMRNTSLMRCGKSCRLRWANHLRPNLRKGAFSAEEEKVIVELHSKLGNKWARISAHLPGRTDNEVKNYWNTRLKRRLRQGIPLYPHCLQHNPSSSMSSPPSPPPAPPTPPSLSHLGASHVPFSFLNPLSMSCPMPFFSIHPMSMLSTPPPIGKSYPFSANLAQPKPFQHNAIGMNFSFPSLDQTWEEAKGFDPRGSEFEIKSELPSNQFFQNENADEATDEVNSDNPNVDTGNSGLLDALLHEARVRGEGKTMKVETVDSDDDHHWENSSSENVYSGLLRKEEEQEDHVNSGNTEDLSGILNLIPSLVRAPIWCNDSGEASAGQSSVVTDENIGLEMPNFASLPEEDDWNVGSYSWDNLPRMY
ncbi:Transcription factor MYB97-like protein [Drosera capensis]